MISTIVSVRWFQYPVVLTLVASSFGILAATQPLAGRVVREVYVLSPTVASGISALLVNRDQAVWAFSDSTDTGYRRAIRFTWTPGTSPVVSVRWRVTGLPSGAQIEGATQSRRGMWIAIENGTMTQLYRCAKEWACAAVDPRPPFLGWSVTGNQGFEGVTTDPEGRVLITATETPLSRAISAGKRESEAFVRFLVYAVEEDGSLSATPRQYEYRADPNPDGADANEFIGIADLLAISTQEALVLERGYFEKRCGNTIRLYRVRFDQGSRLEKVPVLDLREISSELPTEISGRLANFEAMAWHPSARDRKALLMFSDDNFDPANQKTVFLSLAWDRVERHLPQFGKNTRPDCPVNRP